MWSVEVHIPLSLSDAFKLADELEDFIGTPRSFSGAGFGNRDIGWSRLTQEKAEALEEKIMGFFSERVIPTQDDFSDGDPVQIECYEG